MARRIQLLLPLSLLFSATPLSPHSISDASAMASPQVPEDTVIAGRAIDHPAGPTARLHATQGTAERYRMLATLGSQPPAVVYDDTPSHGGEPNGPDATLEHDPTPVRSTTAASSGYDRGSPDPEADAPSPLKPGEHDLVSWAKARFVAAGLAAPSPDVVFVDDRDACRGHLGLFRRADARVSICVSDGAAGHVRRKLMLHELAHAWAHEHLTTADRDAFVELRGAASWNDHDDPWAERGTEHAAEILAWGLLDIPVSPTGVGPADPASLRDAFISVTGVPPINDGSHPAPDPTTPPARPVAERT